METNQILKCHYYHIGTCSKGGSCKFSHEGESLGHCPNTTCPVFHVTIQELMPRMKKKKETPLPLPSISKNMISFKIQQINITDLTPNELININTDKHICPAGEICLEQECLKTIYQQTLIEQKIKEYTSDFQRRISQINLDFQLLSPLEEKLRPKINLDLLFLMDCTGSMGSWIEAAQNEIVHIAEMIQDEHKQSKIKMGFIGYRDFCDNIQHVVIPFTDNYNSLKKSISKIQAEGGGDTAEDLTGALHLGLNLKWTSSVKFMVLVTDAPAHGKKYHDSDDSYPNGDPNGLKLEDIILEYGKRNITICVIEITEITTQMFDMLNPIYKSVTGKNFQRCKLGQSTVNFGFQVGLSASMAISESSSCSEMVQYKNLLRGLKDLRSLSNIKTSEDLNLELRQDMKQNHIEDRIQTNFEIHIDENNEIDQQDEIFDAICHTWYIVKDKNVPINWKNPLVQKSQLKTEISISQNPFSKGAMRWAFKMQDVLLDEKLVAKLPIYISSQYTLEGMKKDVEAYYISNHIVNEFNDRIISIVKDTSIVFNFVHCYIYEILDKKQKFQFYWAENYIKGEFVKYNNNTGWESQNSNYPNQVAQALSHFSWQLTEGYLMIVDLQGSSGYLTDPQIHCLDMKKFGQGNLGYGGMLKFFYSHRCNIYCDQMKLIHPKKQSEIPKDFDLFMEEIQNPYRTQKIQKLCDLCRKPFEIKTYDYINKKKETSEVYCIKCIRQVSKTLQDCVCVSCNYPFRSSKHWFLMKRTDFPKQCGKCRLKNRNILREKLDKLENVVKINQQNYFKKDFTETFNFQF